jgi:hypothetical protein
LQTAGPADSERHQLAAFDVHGRNRQAYERHLNLSRKNGGDSGRDAAVRNLLYLSTGLLA